MRALAFVALLSAGLSACAGSILVTLKREAGHYLKCDCEDSLRHEEITAKVKDLPPDAVGMKKYYRAWCCDREVFLECQAFVREHRTTHTPPAWESERTGDVYWRCWTVEDPTKEKGSDAEVPVP